MASDNERAIERPSDLTAEWLTETLGAGTVSSFTTERIGTGQMSECYRIGLSYSEGDGPRSVVLKVAASDPMSRQTGLTLGLYEREVRFYHDIAPRLGGAIAPCYHAAVDLSTGVFDLLLGDAAPAVVGDEIAGATSQQAHLAVVELARLHAPLLGDAAAAAAAWLNRDSPLSQAMITPLYAGFIDRYGDRVAPQHRTVCDTFIAAFDGYLAQEGAPGRVRGLVHGDYRLDNMLFGAAGSDRALTVVDWQTVSWGPALTDLAYFLGCALSTPDRRTHYDELLRAYYGALGPMPPITLAELRESVRRQSFFGVMMAIVSSMLVERTARGDEMFMTMLQRHCDHVLDTDALATLPAPAQPEPLQPAEPDELAHTATAEPLWSESWYADFVAAAEGLGGWFRLGLIPNQGRAWIHALLCGPDLPTVAVIDVDVPVPADPWAIRTDSIELRHAADAPLHTYRVDLRARGQSYPDPSALLRGEAGEPVDVALNLEWTTNGTPYQYRVTTRYEIPCTVSGTVVVKHARYQIDSVPGQRDHSWGVRDWWSMNWMWSALHLDDGTHLHGLHLTIPNTGELGIGYLQSAEGPLTELQSVTYREAFAPSGLPLDTNLTLNPGDLAADVEVRAHAPVLLTADDGRVSQFPRAWVDITTGDGRRGVGWMEWNRNQP
ncbi:phosphotransferase [Mycobacterium kubicae]|uniref:Phosphotransferase n=1 Tax=Mycobacterium kubicae TaxID=120959 RepID=A0AAX1J5W0_9MYCO|nr:phosphotransferase [Mycobacterium kubicae]MCV7098159.1 phosphotransferase [Mycobacterium kubicae]ORW03535.1 phosphotransferase [Mycobacterium kubicae]QNI12357.1 phosphotransferase [Mycobacterium kubicae]QPI35875.1 phosphotransferase [Mycobacterium kubicae]GFG65366.1 phosphotransferase [Mycobacterium kubicae]